ncbi:hypothetical protein C8Q80DRAFT_1121885 [Daedaleopsis nitida]|nr:hypothetical protein C8Q80DRAFT_1121885 [Daedaleopsis nitida]
MPNFIVLHAEELRLPLSITVLAMSVAFCYMLHIVTAARIPSSHPPNHEQNARARMPHEEGPPPRRAEDTQTSTDSTDAARSTGHGPIRRTVSTHLRQPFAGAKPLARKCSTTFVNNMNKIRPRSQSLSNALPALAGTLKPGKKDRLHNARACSPVHTDLDTLVEATSDDAESSSQASLACDRTENAQPAEPQPAERPQPTRARTHGHIRRSPSHAPTPRPRHLSVTKQPETRTSTRVRTISLRVQKYDPSVSQEPIRAARPACPENSLPRTVLVERYERPFKNFQWPTPAAPEVSTPTARGEPAKRKSKLRRMLSAVVPFAPSKTGDRTPRNSVSDEYDSASPRSSISSEATSTSSSSTAPVRKAASTAVGSMSIIENELTDFSRRGSDATTRSFCVHDGVPCSHPYGSPYLECPSSCQHHCEAKQGRRPSRA